MERWRVHPAAPGLRARVTRDLPPLSAALEREVDRLWTGAQSRMGGRLFNGRVFSADAITPGLLTGHMTEYRRVVAQIERPELWDDLRIRSLAVCGVLRCPDGVIVGRRSYGAIYLAGRWQLPPAGSVDAGALRAKGWLDLESQLFTELQEELGLARQTIAGLRPLCAVEHPGSHVLDLGFLLDCTLPASAVVAAQGKAGDAAEYQDVQVLPIGGLRERVIQLGPEAVPTVPVLLEQAGLWGNVPYPATGQRSRDP